MRRLVLYLLLFTLITPSIAMAKHRHKEVWYQEHLAALLGGMMEYSPPEDNVRIDVLTDTEAIEVDFANKWAEGIGQALYYAVLSGERPCVALIVEKEKEYGFVRRVINTRNGLWIDLKIYVITYKSIPIPDDIKRLRYISIIHVND